MRPKTRAAIYEVHTRCVKLSGLEPSFGVRQKTILFNAIRLIPPVQSALQKYLPSRLAQITSLVAPIPARRRGVSRSSRTQGMGCGGRLSARLTRARLADGEVVWFWRPDADVRLATMLAHRASDGDNKPGLREEHEGNRKTIRAGNAGSRPV